MRYSSAGALSLAVGLFLAVSGSPVFAQQKSVEEKSRLPVKSISGTVKAMKDGGLVVEGKEAGGKNREYAFVVDGGTRIETPGGGGRALREGDSVAVTYAERDGKIVAQTVKLLKPTK